MVEGGPIRLALLQITGHALRCLRGGRDPRDLLGVRCGSHVPQEASKAGSLPSFTLPLTTVGDYSPGTCSPQNSASLHF